MSERNRVGAKLFDASDRTEEVPAEGPRGPTRIRAPDPTKPRLRTAEEDPFTRATPPHTTCVLATVVLRRKAGDGEGREVVEVRGSCLRIVSMAEVDERRRVESACTRRAGRSGSV